MGLHFDLRIRGRDLNFSVDFKLLVCIRFEMLSIFYAYGSSLCVHVVLSQLLVPIFLFHSCVFCLL